MSLYIIRAALHSKIIVILSIVLLEFAKNIVILLRLYKLPL